ncbi:hypothetical protein MPSEU_000171900 [Mayamaea pseudoterrestris]|nr:hypothetical protein MPSEU_000171900 [Mayamaea pseudoterrestris]
MDPKDAYLILYNFLCCAGWALICKIAVQSIFSDLAANTNVTDALSHVYAASHMAQLLWYTQMAAIMEVVHAMLKLVRSPVLVTAMQVGSRIFALLAVAYAPSAQAQWGAGLMILSWSLVEVPRYAFYILAILTGDATKRTPYWLFWLRYSLFAVLYPSGITGELTVFFKAASDGALLHMFGPFAAVLYGKILPAVYFVGSPFMILNMVGNRKSAFKKRFAKLPPPPRGLVWPLDSKGERSSTKINQQIVAAAVGAVNPTKASAVLRSRHWRFQYTKHLRAMVEEQCKSPEAALKIAQAGLNKAYELFEFVAPDGTSTSFKDAMAGKASGSETFHTGFIQGQGKQRTDRLEIPYKGKTLHGKELMDQVDAWVSYGTIEPSCGDAIKKCAENPKWLDVSDRYFVLLGAGSAMGPLLVLMALGANVIAIDLDRPQIWKRLIDIAKNSSGSITFPMKCEQKDCKSEDAVIENAGCNLFTDTPMIRDWLMDLYKGKPFTVGSYAYLNGALHVQVSLAMDSICRDLSEKRSNTSLAYLCTPTDLHLIPEEAHLAQKDHLQEYSKDPYCMLIRLLSGGSKLISNVKPSVKGEGGDYYLVNGISVAQGPNYALAKRMQHWRAIIARSKNCIVSSNIAPSTSTLSVVQNRTFAWAYEGMPYFKPFEIFAPETSNAVMSAILFYDLNDPRSVGNPKVKLSNPNQLFSYGSFHGGLWRCAYEVDSIGEASVFLYFGRVVWPYAVAAGGAAAAFLWTSGHMKVKTLNNQSDNQ